MGGGYMELVYRYEITKYEISIYVPSIMCVWVLLKLILYNKIQNI